MAVYALAIATGITGGGLALSAVEVPQSQPPYDAYSPPQPRQPLVSAVGASSIEEERREYDASIALEQRKQAEAERLAKIEAEERRREIAEAKAISERLASRSSANTAPKPKAKAKAQTQASAMAFEATAYVALCDTGCTGITASGYDVRNTIWYEGMRVIAVDTEVIPLYSIVEVTVAGASFTAIALDTGGAIVGNRIDILVDSEKEAWAFGRRAVTVEIIRRGR